MTLNFIWNIDPQILSSGPFQFKWITVLLLVGVLVGRRLLFFMIQKEGGDTKEGNAIFNYALLGAIAGARFVYAALIEPDSILAKPLRIIFPFDFSHGFVFTGSNQFSLIGGLAGVIIAILIYGRVKRKSYSASLYKATYLFAVVTIFLKAGDFLQSANYGKATNAKSSVFFANPIKQRLTQLPCCVMRIPDGKNPLDKVIIKPGKVLVHQGDGYQPIIMYLFFTAGATEQLVNEYLIGDVKTALHQMPDLVFEPGTDPLHFTIFQEGEGQYVARIQSIGIARHPVQLYECFALVLLLIIMLWYWNKVKKSQHTEMISGMFIAAISGIHFMIQFFYTTKPIISNLPISGTQSLSLILCITGVFLLFSGMRKQKSTTSLT